MLHEAVKEIARAKIVQEALTRTPWNPAIRVRDKIKAFGKAAPRKQTM